MLIERYFAILRAAVEACPLVRTYRLTYDRRGPYEGYVRGEIDFVDGSVLHIREFLDTELDVERLMYVYQYMSSGQGFVFRYDNTGHHLQLGLPTYPDHKHEGSEDNVVSSSAPELTVVLREIETMFTPKV